MRVSTTSPVVKNLDAAIRKDNVVRAGNGRSDEVANRRPVQRVVLEGIGKLVRARGLLG